MTTRRSSLALVLPLFALAGCGAEGPYSGTLYPVTGRVLLADGKPLSGGSVQFIPAEGGLPAAGDVDQDGHFTLKTFRTREGAAPGKYKVRVEPSSEFLARKGKNPKLPFAARYREYDGETGLTATVRSGPTELEPFRLEAR
ncbi:carboxypeptidase-like regulatory domain-containing protein [Aquisphaera insulae]|uniref:carboxypeptidase-like regulatory domain-containing protein n=1 Tax=Aquisphaera insulae TaxID=2712864 RepID=UPI0013EA6574|nr:carboxypeptidase-like regulatory domain-containing protein [Aquisphaera insulae]